MTPGKSPGRTVAVGYRLIVVGLLLVAAAPAVDLYLDATPGSPRHAIPEFLVPAYDQGGKFAVVGVVVALGVMATLWGCFLRAAGTGRPARRPDADEVTGNGGGRLVRALGGEVTLETARYFRDEDE
jgi:hypothetical protein